jgi:hypothetical protein
MCHNVLPRLLQARREIRTSNPPIRLRNGVAIDLVQPVGAIGSRPGRASIAAEMLGSSLPAYSAPALPSSPARLASAGLREVNTQLGRLARGQRAAFRRTSSRLNFLGSAGKANSNASASPPLGRPGVPKGRPAGCHGRSLGEPRLCTSLLPLQPRQSRQAAVFRFRDREIQRYQPETKGSSVIWESLNETINIHTIPL